MDRYDSITIEPTSTTRSAVTVRDDVAEAVLRGPEAIVAAGQDGVITFWNPAAERVFGFSEVEAIGRSLDIIIPERLRERHWTGWAGVMTSGRSRYGEGEVLSVPALRKDGTRISVEFVLHPIAGPAGDLVGLAATLRDVTERFEQMKALRQAADRS